MSDKQTLEMENVRTLDVEQLQVLGFNYGHFVRPDKARGVAAGRCINVTGEKLAVYGPKHPDDSSNFENSLYVLPSGYQTPDNWWGIRSE